MSDEQHQSRHSTPSGSGTGASGGDRWGDSITPEREAELKALADRQRVWVAQSRVRRGPSPMSGIRLAGADLFWLVAYTLAGLDGDLAAARLMLIAATTDTDARRSVEDLRLHLEGAEIPAVFRPRDDTPSFDAATHGEILIAGEVTFPTVDSLGRLLYPITLGTILAGAVLEQKAIHSATMDESIPASEAADDAEEATRGMPAPKLAPPFPPPAPEPQQGRTLHEPPIPPQPPRRPPPAPAAPPQQGWTLHEPPSDPASAAQTGAWSAQPPSPPPFAQPGQPSGTIAQPDEPVAFTSHYPREVAPKVWERLLVFIALDTPRAAAQVEALAAERLRQRRDAFRAAQAPSPSPLRRGTRLTIVPNLPGMRADPASLTAEWVDDAQCYEFRLRAEDAPPGLAVNGFVEILEGPILRGEIPLAIFVRGARQPAPDTGHDAVAHVAAYRHTFPSYARRDEAVVRAFETVVEAGGDRFLRDVRTLRAGEHWEPGLQALIERADVFQLFWSQRAATSQQVEHEWRYALAHAGNRPNFIRPIYWTPQPYTVPAELRVINFARLDPAALALARTSWWGGLFGRR